MHCVYMRDIIPVVFSIYTKVSDAKYVSSADITIIAWTRFKDIKTELDIKIDLTPRIRVADGLLISIPAPVGTFAQSECTKWNVENKMRTAGRETRRVSISGLGFPSVSLFSPSFPSVDPISQGDLIRRDVYGK